MSAVPLGQLLPLFAAVPLLSAGLLVLAGERPRIHRAVLFTVLGLVTAGAGAVAGPWPMKTDPLTQLKPLLDMIPGVKLPEKLNLVEKGETAYAFVPASPTAGSGGTMQVAWFNTSTLQGGFADLDPITDRTALTALPLLSGVRLAPVKTGSGTILSAVFGNASNGTQNCWFLPAVGIVNA